MNSEQISQFISQLSLAKEETIDTIKKYEKAIDLEIKRQSDRKNFLIEADRKIAELEYLQAKELARENNVMSQMNKEIQGVPNPLAPKEQETFDEWYERIHPKPSFEEN